MKTKQVLQKIEYVMHSRFFLPACLVVALVLRLAWVKVAHTVPVLDWEWYMGRAISIADGNGYSFNGVPTAYYPVGWPALLGILFALFGVDIFAGQMANIILYIGIIIICYLITRSLFQSKSAAALTALFLAIYPNHIGYCSLIGSETLYTFLNLLGLLLLMRSRHRVWMLIASGIVLGCAILTREQGYLVPLIAAIFFARRDRFLGVKGGWVRSSAIMFVAVFLTVIPWTIRNYVVFGHFIPVSTNPGVNLWIGNNPYQTGTNCSDARMIGVIKQTELKTDGWGVDVACRQRAIRYILENPVKTIKFIPKKIEYTYRWDWDSLEWGTPDSPQARVLKVLCKLFYCPVMLLFFASVVTFFVKKKKKLAYNFPTLGLWLIGYWLLGNVITYGYPRYHYAAMPFIIMYAAAFICGAMFTDPRAGSETADLMSIGTNHRKV